MPLLIAGTEINDVVLSVTVPFIIYWVTAGIYEFLGSLKAFEKYRIHPSEDEAKYNLVRFRLRTSLGFKGFFGSCHL
jgi:hypothetical protein